ALVLAAALVAPPVLACPTDFNFKDVELANIFQTIAVLGKFNVIVVPEVARTKAVVSLRQVEPLDGPYDVAKMNGLQAAKVRHDEGTTATTYVVGTAAQIQAMYGKQTRIIKLRYASAAHVARSLGDRIEGMTGFKCAIDERTNRMILCGT